MRKSILHGTAFWTLEKDDQIVTHSSHFQSDLSVSYKDLVRLFGPPTIDKHVDYKTDVEWIIADPQGRPIHIYNYKNGPSYLGDDSTPIEHIQDWNVGSLDRAEAFEMMTCLWNELNTAALDKKKEDIEAEDVKQIQKEIADVTARTIALRIESIVQEKMIEHKIGPDEKTDEEVEESFKAIHDDIINLLKE